MPVYTQKVLLGCGRQGGSCNAFHFLSEIRGYYPPENEEGREGIKAVRERIFSTVVSENGSEIPLGKQSRVSSWHRGLCRDQGLSVDLGCHLAVILCDFLQPHSVGQINQQKHWQLGLTQSGGRKNKGIRSQRC